MATEFAVGVPLVCRPAEHLYIAVAAYSGSVSVQTFNSVNLAGVELLNSGVRVTTNFVAGCCYLDHTRNLLARQFLDSDATDLLFVDADVGFEGHAPAAIAMQERPLVAGVYPKKIDPLQWPLHFGGAKLTLGSDGLIKAPLLPTGFMRVNRVVFEKMRDSGLAPAYDDAQVGEMWGFFQCTIEDRTYWGEDYNFCRRWAKLGGESYVMPDLAFTHTGLKNWSGNLMQWISQNATSKTTVPDADGTSSAA